MHVVHRKRRSQSPPRPQPMRGATFSARFTAQSKVESRMGPTSKGQDERPASRHREPSTLDPRDRDRAGAIEGAVRRRSSVQLEKLSHILGALDDAAVEESLERSVYTASEPLLVEQGQPEKHPRNSTRSPQRTRRPSTCAGQLDQEASIHQVVDIWRPRVKSVAGRLASPARNMSSPSKRNGPSPPGSCRVSDPNARLAAWCAKERERALADSAIDSPGSRGNPSKRVPVAKRFPPKPVDGGRDVVAVVPNTLTLSWLVAFLMSLWTFMLGGASKPSKPSEPLVLDAEAVAREFKAAIGEMNACKEELFRCKSALCQAEKLFSRAQIRFENISPDAVFPSLASRAKM